MRPGDTPVPIPNTTVKAWAADGTALETAWKSRRLPDNLKRDGLYLENCTYVIISFYFKKRKNVCEDRKTSKNSAGREEAWLDRDEDLKAGG